jgi:hypothetical protein
VGGEPGAGASLPAGEGGRVDAHERVSDDAVVVAQHTGVLAPVAQIPLETQALVRTQRGVEGGVVRDRMSQRDRRSEHAPELGLVGGAQRPDAQAHAAP